MWDRKNYDIFSTVLYCTLMYSVLILCPHSLLHNYCTVVLIFSMETGDLEIIKMTK